MEILDRDVDAPVVDAAPPIDAAPTCAADTITCTAGTYVECGPDGFATRTLTCPLGCATDVAKCLDIDPRNGLATYLDMVASPPDIVLRGAATIDSTTGLLFDAGTNIPIPMFDTPFDTRVYVVNSAIARYFPPRRAFDMTDLISRARRLGGKVGVFPVTRGAWTDVGQWAEYFRTMSAMRRR